MKKKLLFSLAMFPAVGITAVAVFGFFYGASIGSTLAGNISSNMVYSRDFSLCNREIISILRCKLFALLKVKPNYLIFATTLVKRKVYKFEL